MVPAMSTARMTLVLLWHQHQPPYAHPTTGRHVMPWVRLHAAKDYVDMVTTLLAAPARVRATFNLTPVLVAQLQDLARDPDRDLVRALCGRRVSELGPGEREMLSRRCLGANEETMVAPYPRYAALARKVHAGTPVTDAELLDLTVWFHLAWCGTTLRSDPTVQALIAQGRGFSSAQRADLLGRMDAVVARTLAVHREAAESGRIELSTSPFYHPILPLLCRTEAAAEAEEGIPLPGARFRHPEDASLQLERAFRLHTEVFGAPPRGVWPSEGAVSEEALGLVAAAGAQWAATDEALLRGAPADRVWSFRGLGLLFRDHALSDRIGFVYSRWDPEHAADDFVQRLRERAAHSKRPHPIITVALDGENAWEYFPGGGYDFLAALYRRLGAAKDIRMATPSEVLSEHTPEPLERIVPGTWIDGSFRTWMGDPLKNRAWELLAYARQAFAETAQPSQEAVEALLAAEASDWFWWYGEGHSSADDSVFDSLFRAHLQAVYERLGVPVPESLRAPLVPAARDDHRMEPLRLGRPTVDGRRTPFYKWVSGGRLPLRQGAIHRHTPMFVEAWAMYDAEVLTLRVDTATPAEELLADGCVFELHVGGQRITLDAVGGSGALQMAARQVVEVAVPLPAGTEAAIYWRLLRGGEQLDRFPTTGNLYVALRGAALEHENWVV